MVYKHRYYVQYYQKQICPHWFAFAAKNVSAEGFLYRQVWQDTVMTLLN